jgi:serine/threonine protein kinase
MAKDRIIRVGEKKYKIKSYVHAGQFGTVYDAVLQSENGEEGKEPVAIKIPAPNLNKEQLETFKGEYKFMTALRGKIQGNKKFIPWIEEGVEEGESEADKKEVLVMEYIDKDTMLGTILRKLDEKPLDKERLAITAAVQYAKLLVALHNLGYTCQDRKTTDLRWKSDKLIVLDWNVVREGTEKEYISKDIFKFGSLWYQLLVGRFPSESPDIFDDGLWRDGKISYGTRRILNKALSASSVGCYLDANALLSELEELLGLYLKESPDLLNDARPWFKEASQSDQQVQTILTQAQRNLDPRQGSNVIAFVENTFSQGWKALSYFDLALRIKPTEAGSERNDCLKLVKEQPERLIRHLRHAFNVSNYKTGLDVAEWVKKAADDAREYSLQLRAARWEALLSAYREGLDVLTDSRPLFEQLIKYLEGEIKIEREELISVLETLDQVLDSPSLPNITKTRLGDLRFEAEIRDYLSQIGEANRMGEYNRALEITRKALAMIDLISPSYKILLFQVIPDLKALGEDLELKARAAGENIKIHWRDEIINALGKPETVRRLLTSFFVQIQQEIGEDSTEVVWLKELDQFYRNASRGIWEGIGTSVVEILKVSPDDWKSATKIELLNYLGPARMTLDECVESNSGKFIDIALEIGKALERIQPYVLPNPVAPSVSSYG